MAQSPTLLDVDIDIVIGLITIFFFLIFFSLLDCFSGLERFTLHFLLMLICFGDVTNISHYISCLLLLLLLLLPPSPFFRGCESSASASSASASASAFFCFCFCVCFCCFCCFCAMDVRLLQTHSCWTQYLSTALEAAHTATRTRCPWPGCAALAHDDAFARHLPAAQRARFRRFVRRAYVDANPKAKWCPAPGCERAIVVDVGSRRKAVECACGLRWCFQCADADVGDHAPASCADVEAWLQKASDESENLTWLAANTKKCPQW